MPHVIVKLYAGRSDDEKARLADAIVNDVMAIIGSAETSVSVAIEDVAPRDWMDQVYQPDIVSAPGQLYKAPGYGPLAGK